ncbi:MAG: hypothetical protein BWY76_03295 [bacterium ADurb.Bin429]|nr:MAG: hypothetical protein BWY76_03295 [bacterium ADurb.Bin429]
MAYWKRLAVVSGAPLLKSMKSPWLASQWLTMYPWR